MLKILNCKTLYIIADYACMKGFRFEKEYLSRQQSAHAHFAKRELNIKTKSAVLFVIFC